MKRTSASKRKARFSMGRRRFLGAAAAAAISGTKSVRSAGAAATSEPTSAPIDATVGNGVSPAMQFQAWPGGTGDFLRKTAIETGAGAFQAEAIEIEPWTVPVPDSEESVAFLPVHRLAALIRDRHFTSVRLTRIYLDRLRRLDPTLLCAVTIMEESAMQAARQADAEIEAGRWRGPLHGIPWGVKDLFSTRDAPTTWGAGEFSGRMIDEDAEVVSRLRDAGAVLIAKLSTGRLAINDVWFRGRTRNPWNTKQGSSGSSAGPASATAAGCVGFSIGTETRGSIVSPTIRCGLSALRPTYGRVSRHGGMTLAWSMDRVGPICRTIEDCALVFAAIHGTDPKDSSTLTAPFHWDPHADLSKLRIGFDRQAPENFIAKLRELGADPHPIGPRPRFSGIDVLEPESAAAFDGFLAAGILRDIDSPQGGPGRGRFTDGRRVSAVEFLHMQQRRQELLGRMSEFMKDLDMYVSGSGDVTLTSLTGNPAAVLPHDVQDGRPICTTIIGNLFADDRILSVAHAVQSATDWHKRHPKLDA